jgi:hypothetical protein
MTTAHEITTCMGKGRACSERTLMVSLNRLFMTVLARTFVGKTAVTGAAGEIRGAQRDPARFVDQQAAAH